MAKNQTKFKDNKKIMIIALIVAVLVFGGIGTYFLTSSSAGACKASPEERKGSSGKCVRIIQEMLNLNNGAGLGVDGSFGPKTDTAVRAFQTKFSIQSDGRVGPITWGRLCYVATAQSPGAGKQTVERNIERYAALKKEAGC